MKSTCTSKRFRSLLAPEDFHTRPQKRLGPLFSFGLMLLLAFGALTTATAQVAVISYSAAGGAPLLKQDVVACDGMAFNQVRIVVTNNSADNMLVTIDLPPGVFYETGSITTISQLGGLSVAESNISNLNAPVFAISPGNLSSGNEIVLQWDRRADMGCDAYNHLQGGGTFKDEIYVVTDGGNVEDVNPSLNSYNLLAPSLSMTGPAPVTTIVGSTLTRMPITITNGGQGYLSNYTFFIVEGAGLNTTQLETSPGGTVIPVASTNGDTSFYTLTPALIAEFGDNDNRFENGEQVMLKRTVQVLSCNTSNGYGAYWGCPGRCQYSNFVNDQINIATGVPAIRLTNSTTIQRTNMCDHYIGEYTYTNNGSETLSGAGAAFDISTLWGINWGNPNKLDHVNQVGVVIDVRLNGNTLAFTKPNAIQINLNQLLTDPDGPGGLDDLDGDGQFDDLPVGQSYTIQVEMRIDCQASCPTIHNGGLVRTTVDYKNQCDAAIDRFFNSAIPNVNNNPKSTTPAFTGPSDINDASPFTLNFSVDRYEFFPNGGAYYNCPDDSLLLTIDVPVGFSLVPGSGIFEGSPTNAFQIGNQVFVVGNASGNLADNNADYSVNLVLDCATWGGGTDFHLAVKYICDETCACQERWGCFDWSPLVHCPAPCVPGGLTTTYTEARRSTMGWTNTSLSTLADPNTLPALNLKRGLPCDTICILAKSIQNGGTSGPTWDNGWFEFSYSLLGGATLLGMVNGGTVDWYDASSGTTTTCALPTPIETTSGGRHTILYNLSSCLSGSMLEPGDSMNLNIKTVVRDNGSLSGNPTIIDGTKLRHFNLKDTIPVNGVLDTLYCDNYGLELYLHRYRNVISGGTTLSEAIGCSTYTISHGDIISGVSSDHYPGEIRTGQILDSLVLVLNTGDVYIPNTANFSANINDPVLGNLSSTIALPAPTVVGNTLTWVNPGNWPVNDPNQFSSFGWSINLITACNSIDNSNLLTTYFTSNRHSHDAGCYYNYNIPRGNLVTHTKPIHNLQDLTGTVSATQGTVVWNTEIQNISNVSSRYIWVAFEDLAAANLSITSVVNTNTAMNLPLIPYANGVWVQVQTALGAATNIPLEVTAMFTGCAPDSLQMLQGWNCPGYPSNPTTYPCPPKSVKLRATPLPSEVQLQVTSQPTPPLSLCVPLDNEVLLSSAQAAYLDNPRLAVKLPTGLTPLGATVNVEYPDASGNIEALSFTQSNDTIYINLEDHSQMGATGMPGTQDALGTDEREARIALTFITTCDFVSGDNIRFIALGRRPRGAPAIGNGTTVLSSDMFIIGAEPPYVGNIILTLTAGNPMVGCGLFPVDVEMDLTQLSSNFSSINDTVYITLPAGVSYEPGTYICTSMPASNCPVFVETRPGAMGATIVVLAMPNPPINLAGGVMLDFGIQARATSNSGCATLGLSARLTQTIIGLACPTQMSGMCDKTAIQLAYDEIMLMLSKPVLSLGTPTARECATAPGSITVEGNLSIGTEDLEAGESVTLNIYCADGSGNPTGAPVATQTINGPVTAGTLTPFSHVVVGCNSANGLVVTASGTCVCATVSALVPVTVSAPAPSISGTPTVCVGAMTQLSGTPGVTAPATVQTEVWASSMPAVATVDNTGKVTGVAYGTSTISYTVTDSDGCSSSTTIVVTVLARPMPTISGNAPVCVGAMVQLTGISGVVAPATLQTSAWVSATPAVATVDNTGKVTGITAGTSTISYTVTDDNGCSSSTTVVVTVNALPAPTIVGTPSVCVGAMVQLTGASGVVAPATVQTSGWSSSTPAVATVDNTGKVTGLTTGSTTITYQVTDSNGCSASTSVVVTVNALPAPSISGTASVCIGAMTQLSGTPGVVAPAVLVTGIWASGTPGVATVDVTGKVTGLSAGTSTISYTVTDNNGCSSSTTVVVTVHALPAPSISGNAPVCAGAMVQLSGTPGVVAPATLQTAVWASATPAVATVDNSGKVTALSGGTSTISYTVTDNNGCSSSTTVVVTVNALPTVYDVAGGGTYCAGGPGLPVGLSDSEAGVNYQLKRNGTNVGAPVAGTGAGISFGNQTLAGTYTVEATLQANTACTSIMNGSVDIIITDLIMTDVITHSPDFCMKDPGPVVGLSGSKVGVSYQLQTGAGANLGAPVAGTGSPIFFGTYPNGNYRVIASDGMGCTASATGTVNATPGVCEIDVPNFCACADPGGFTVVTIKITAPAGQNWTVKEVIGLYGTTNPYPQVTVGTPLNYIGGNMYTLDAARSNIHGFYIKVTNGFTDLDIMVGNPSWL